MLASLLNIPANQNQWNSWSLTHKTSHDKIRQALVKQLNKQTFDYVLDPINFDAPDGFLQKNQQTHTEMNQALGIQGSDLEELDFQDGNQVQAWIWLHYLEHQNAEAALKI